MHALSTSPNERSTWRVALLLGLLLASAALQLVRLDSVPAGLNPDEASNAWDAWNLLHTGRDQHGVEWPLFYVRAFGENRSPLYVYLLLPFQAVGGLNVWTTRLPNVVGGLATLLLTAWIATRLFDRDVGLAAAATLLLTPWHLQLGGWGHEGCLTAFLCAAPIAAWLWARLPFGDRRAKPRAGRTLFAGLLTGVCCYGYPAVRLFLPAMLFMACALARGRPSANDDARADDRRQALHADRDATARRSSLLAFAVGLTLTFGPLAWQHVFNAEEINKRGVATWVWTADDTLGQRVGKVASRYMEHFGPDFLFLKGDVYLPNWPGGSGVLNAALALPLALGVGVCVARGRRSSAARFLLLWLLLYPVGDMLSTHFSGHMLRAAPGAPAFAILTGLGIVCAARWLAQRRRFVTLSVASIAFAFAAIEWQATFAARRLGAAWNSSLREAHHTDLLEAARWLRSRLDDYDAVSFTTHEFNQGYVVVLVGMEYDPRRWASEPRDVVRGRDWDTVRRAGKLDFLDRGCEAFPELSGPVRLLSIARLFERPDRTPLVTFGSGGTLAAFEDYCPAAAKSDR